MKSSIIMSLGILGIGTIGCGSASSASESSDAVDAARTEATKTTHYFALRADARRCSAPECGGYYVRALNESTTRCANGTEEPECYVGSLDWSALKLTEQQQQSAREHAAEFVVLAQLRPVDAEAQAVLRIQDAWRGHAPATGSDTFFRVKFNGVVCITDPCPSYTSEELNHPHSSKDIAEVDFSGLGRTPAEALELLNSRSGLILHGVPTQVTGTAGTAPAVWVGDYYLPFPEQDRSCGAGLPSRQINEYCRLPNGQCSAVQSGQCPVCGCDGVTYASTCVAHLSGVPLDHPGQCDDAQR